MRRVWNECNPFYDFWDKYRDSFLVMRAAYMSLRYFEKIPFGVSATGNGSKPHHGAGAIPPYPVDDDALRPNPLGETTSMCFGPLSSPRGSTARSWRGRVTPALVRMLRDT